VLALLGGMLWQWQGRAHQRIDLGSPLDDNGIVHFHAAERAQDGPVATYRWSYPSATIQLAAPPPGSAAIVRLRLFAPPQPDGPQRAVISANGQPLAEVPVEPRPRTYTFEVSAPPSGPLEIGIESRRLAVSGDPRELGVAVDSVELDATGGPSPLALLAELWSAPLLPAALLLLALATLLLRRPYGHASSSGTARWPAITLAAGAIPAAALLALVLADRWLRDVRLLLAWYVFVMAAIVLAAIVLAEALRRLPRLLPLDDKRAARWIVLAFTVALVATFIPGIRSDGVEYYAYLRSLAVDGDLNFKNDYQDSPFAQVSGDLGPIGNGYYQNLASVGPAIAWSPLYTVAHLIVLGGRALGLPWKADGYDEPYIVLVTFASALATLITMLAGYRICRRWTGPPVAALAVIAGLFGSNLLFYGMRQGSFAHAVSGCAATLYVLAWLRLEERPSIGRWAAVGASAGAMVLMYWISALVLVLPALTFARLLAAALRGPRERSAAAIRQIILGGAVAAALLLLVFSPQMIAWGIIYGSFLANPHGGNYTRVREFQGLKLLFSHLYGLLPWTPAFFAGLVGLPLLWRRDRWVTACLAVAFLAYFGYNASLGRWFAGGSFGLRRMTVVAPWFLLGLALLLDALRRWRRAAPAALAALMGAWSWLLLVRYDLFLIPHVPEEIADMPAQAFYLSRDTLPFWGIRGWLRAGFFIGKIREVGSAGGLGELLALTAAMALLIWAVVAAYNWLSWPQRGARVRAWRVRAGMPSR
jgi:hypothetical protein